MGFLDFTKSKGRLANVDFLCRAISNFFNILHFKVVTRDLLHGQERLLGTAPYNLPYWRPRYPWYVSVLAACF